MYTENTLAGSNRPLPLQPVSSPRPATSGGLAPWQAKRIAAHIEANLEKSLLAPDMAAVTRLSVSHFSRAFTVTFGQSPHAYIITRRIERAKYLMLANDLIPLAQVALSCGLSDQAHLSRLFRKVVEESPAAWRRKRWSPGGHDGSPTLVAPIMMYQ